MALSFPRLDSPDQVQISRVGFHGLLQDPDYPETNHAHEFISLAAPDKDRTTMVEGKAALKEDKCIPIKTMLVYLALHKARPYRSTLVFVRLPRGECLLSMIREGTITDCMMRDVIIKHLERLRRMALEQARKNGVEITLLGVTYPHYLFLNQGSSDFDDFMDTYLGLLSSVWGSITFRVISEGQAIAKYICVPFYDSIGGAIREQIAELFKGLQLKRAWVRLIIVDGGSSSLVRNSHKTAFFISLSQFLLTAVAERLFGVHLVRRGRQDEPQPVVFSSGSAKRFVDAPRGLDEASIRPHLGAIIDSIHRRTRRQSYCKRRGQQYCGQGP